MEHPVQADGTMTTAVAGSAATPPRACCQAEDNAPSAVISFGRAVPPEDAVALDAEAALFPSAASHPPPRLPAPVPDRPEHLTPSLAALSISRT